MEPTKADRLQCILENRHSERGPFDPGWPVSERELAYIVDAARWAPTAHNMQNFRLVVVDDRHVLARLGATRCPVSPTFIVENFRQLSFSADQLAERGTGLPGTMFPAAWHTDDPARVPSHASQLLGDALAGAPMFIVVVFDASERAPDSEADVQGMISLGCVVENMWLAAHTCHLDVQLVSAIAGTEAELEVRRQLGIPPPWRIALGLRLGHARSRSSELRVRRAPATFVSRNRFA